MSALPDAVVDGLVEAVAEKIAARLEPFVRDTVRSAVAELRTGDAGDELDDAEATAKRLGMTAAALRRAAERGRAPIEPIKVGRRLRWRRADVLAYLSRPR